MKVLAVDDDPVTLELVRAVLRSGGYQVLTATGGAAAYEIIEREEIRLVVTDWEMADEDGLTLCRRIRNGMDAYVYLILLTSHVTRDEIVQGLSAGADDFIGKPFNPAELLLRLRAGERILSIESRDVTLFAIAKLAESRDPETGSHLERIRTYSRVLAREAGRHPDFAATVTPSFARLIYLTSPLHDIGKVAIPDFVLLKPDRLTEREFDIMKAHTVAGARTIDAALREHPGAFYLRMARDIAAYHHERWDGNGYPEGLAGDAIPLCARIVALADVYDALTSKRVYKPEFDTEVARGFILAESGKRFDPRIVDAFVGVEAEFGRICAHYRRAEAPADAPPALLTDPTPLPAEARG